MPVILVFPLAFICEFFDSALGMGYGTTLVPILLMLGFEPLQIIPAILFSEFVSGINSAFFHHSVRNVDLHPRSNNLRVALVLGGCSILGVIVSVFVAINIPKKLLILWIGIIVISMAIMIFVTFKRNPRFRWRKIVALGTLASFNKGLSGGGYGPLVMGGQMLSGVSVKNAVGITALSEGLTCFVGLLLYYFLKPEIDWTLAPWLMAGAVLSIPFATYFVKRVPEEKIKWLVGWVILILGLLTIGKVIFF